jgi:hypothetical protein
MAGLRRHALSIIDAVWERELLVPKSGGCYGCIFQAHHSI